MLRRRRGEDQGGNASYNYNPVAWSYEKTSSWYSLGRIRASKAWQVDRINQRQRVLYCGVGTGEDAVLAASRGARVTCIDIADKMLVRVERKLAAKGIDAELICGDITTWQTSATFDVVIANYFLNIFDDTAMHQVLDRLMALLAPEGSLMIADFMPPRDTGVRGFLQRAYRVVANGLYWAGGLSHLGVPREYPDVLAAAGLEVVAVQEFPVTRWGPRSYWSIVAARP